MGGRLRRGEPASRAGRLLLGLAGQRLLRWVRLQALVPSDLVCCDEEEEEEGGEWDSTDEEHEEG